jgi:hypothetical protein
MTSTCKCAEIRNTRNFGGTARRFRRREGSAEGARLRRKAPQNARLRRRCHPSKAPQKVPSAVLNFVNSERSLAPCLIVFEHVIEGD